MDELCNNKIFKNVDWVRVETFLTARLIPSKDTKKRIFRPSKKKAVTIFLRMETQSFLRYPEK